MNKQEYIDAIDIASESWEVVSLMYKAGDDRSLTLSERQDVIAYADRISTQLYDTEHATLDVEPVDDDAAWDRQNREFY